MQQSYLNRTAHYCILIASVTLSNHLYGGILPIKTMAEFRDLTTRNQPVMVQFAAEWCSMCKSVKQPLQEVMLEPEFSHITFARVDEDMAPDVSTKNSIVGFPTFMFFNNGVKKHEQVGVKKVAQFKEELRGNLRRYCQS